MIIWEKEGRGICEWQLKQVFFFLKIDSVILLNYRIEVWFVYGCSFC